MISREQIKSQAGRRAMEAVAVLVLLLCIGCVGGRKPVISESVISVQRSVPPMPARSATVESRELSVQRQSVMAAAPEVSATNTVTLAWNAVDEDWRMAFRLYRNGVGEAYTTNWQARSVTLTNVPAGTHEFYLVAVGWDDAESDPSNTVSWTAPQTARLAFAPYIFRAEWPGSPGVLEVSTNLLHWTARQSIATGDTVLVTNSGPREFFRVRLN